MYPKYEFIVSFSHYQQSNLYLIIFVDDKSPNPYLMWSISRKHARSFRNPVCQHHIPSFCMVVLEPFLKPDRLHQIITVHSVNNQNKRKEYNSANPNYLFCELSSFIHLQLTKLWFRIVNPFIQKLVRYLNSNWNKLSSFYWQL